MSNWHPISTAPTDGTIVDIWVAPEGQTAGRYADMYFQAGDVTTQGDWHDEHGMFSLVGDSMARLDEVTHWMPRPDAPPVTPARNQEAE